MALSLEFVPDLTSNARAVYRRSEFALEYAADEGPSAQKDLHLQSTIETALGMRIPKWFGIADTATLVFSGSDADLVAFDAYTNIDRWTHTAEVPLPEISGVGRMRLASPPRDTDRIDLGVVPRFNFSPSQGRLLITLGQVGIRHYQLSTCLIIGIADDGVANFRVSNLILQ